MKKVIIVGLSVVLCCLVACGQSETQEEQYVPNDNSEQHGLSEMEREKQSSYDAGYEAGFEAGVKEGVHNPGDYISDEEAEAAEEDLEDYFQEYAEENGYYKVN